MRIAGFVRRSFVDGRYIRFAIFFQGCTHNCPGCHNPDTHDVNGGTEVEIEELEQEILKTIRFIDGITLTGGDPLLQSEACIQLAEFAHRNGLDVWCYTGWTLEQIKDGAAGEKAKEALSHIDILVDGPFIQTLKSDELKYRGSSNQRIISLRK